jgi:hypothetical protein
MRRYVGGIGCGARGREGTLLALPGGAGLRPGTLGCPARSSLTAWALWGPGRKRGPDAVQRRDGAPRGARILQKRMRKTEVLVRRSVLHPLDWSRGNGREDGVPGAARIRAMTLVYTPILSINRVLPILAATKSLTGPSLVEVIGASVSAWRASR